MRETSLKFRHECILHYSSATNIHNWFIQRHISEETKLGLRKSHLWHAWVFFQSWFWFLLSLPYLCISSYCMIMVCSLSLHLFCTISDQQRPWEKRVLLLSCSSPVCASMHEVSVRFYLCSSRTLCDSAPMSFLKNVQHLGKRQKQNHREEVHFEFL